MHSNVAETVAAGVLRRGLDGKASDYPWKQQARLVPASLMPRMFKHQLSNGGGREGPALPRFQARVLRSHHLQGCRRGSFMHQDADSEQSSV